MTAEDQARLAAAWIKSGRPEIFCMSCGGLRKPTEPPCRCRLEKSA